jgi:uncharacterized phiE125 gp8 family phage protein
MAAKVTVEPSEEAISLEEAQFHVKADADPDNDTILNRAIVTARQRAEHELGRPLLPQTCEKRFESFERRMYLWEDVTKIVSIDYVDSAGADASLGPMDFYLSGASTARILGSLPAVREVTITFECGAFESDTVPESVIEWMLLQVGAISENRSSVDSVQTYELPGRFTDGLLDRYRFLSV